MSNIEINTAQNVTIEYELATLKDRAFAYFLDLIIMGVCFIIFLLLFLSITKSGDLKYFNYIIIIPISFFYSILFEVLKNGQTPGKIAMKIKVVKVDGKEPMLNSYLTRWVFSLLDIHLTFGSVATILVSSTRNHQRLGDILANTTVIRFKPNYSLNLSDLINRASLETYVPQYPEVRKFTDADMLLVKNTIERVREYPNQAHAEALTMLVDRIKDQLGIVHTPKNKLEFLKTLLKDYIVLTR